MTGKRPVPHSIKYKCAESTPNTMDGASLKRPTFQKMISDIGEGNFPAILITQDTSRLARNELQAGIHKE